MAGRLYRRRDAAREIGVVMRNNGQLKEARSGLKAAVAAAAD
jgi:hypothetical protein